MILRTPSRGLSKCWEGRILDIYQLQLGTLKTNEVSEINILQDFERMIFEGILNREWFPQEEHLPQVFRNV